MTTLSAPPATSRHVRSALYPESWRPGLAHADGHWLPDFSYAGYRQGTVPLPAPRTDVFADASRPPYGADSTGKHDAAPALQRALDDAGRAGGGVVTLPPGLFRLRLPEGADTAVRIRHPRVVLRGAGAGRTRLWFDETETRGKNALAACPDHTASWFVDGDVVSRVCVDLDRPTRTIPVEDVEGFAVGDKVLLRTDATEAFIAEHGMAEAWKPGDWPMRGLALLRRIVAVDRPGRTLRLDAPTYYDMKTRDNLRVVKTEDVYLREVGFEDFSIGMTAHPDLPPWHPDDPVDESFMDPERPTYHVHACTALRMAFCEDGYIRRVDSFRPDGNALHHIHSNGIRLDYGRRITVADAHWQNPQYRGGGGNGYLFTLNANDCLLTHCTAERGRHNYDFQNMHTAGNVVHRCVGRDGDLPSDFHMYLSTGNLIDQTTMDGDLWEIRHRPYGGAVMHGQPGAGNVFWNTEGLRYPPGKDSVVDARQLRRGMVIGTRGPCAAVSARTDGWVECVGEGDRLQPPSLWRDQLRRRLSSGGSSD